MLILWVILVAFIFLKTCSESRNWECPKCKGSGIKDSCPCPHCQGTGKYF